jgi:hypothetical protein
VPTVVLGAFIFYFVFLGIPFIEGNSFEGIFYALIESLFFGLLLSGYCYLFYILIDQDSIFTKIIAVS